MSTTVQSFPNNNINNNKSISQLAVLRDMIIDERKKRENLEKKFKIRKRKNFISKRKRKFKIKKYYEK